MARTEKYLPQGSRLVIRAGERPAAWYETKKEVILTTTPVETECPITGDPVVTATEQKVQIWFQPRMVRSRVVLEAGDVDESTFGEQFSLLHYDIKQASGFPNPSAKLYPIGVRLTESAWIIRTSDTPYNLMAKIQDAGCKIEANKFDVSESRRLIHQAVAQLQEELAAAVQRNNECMEEASRNLEAGVDSKGREVDPEVGQQNYLRLAQNIEKRLTLLAADIKKAAQRFGINEQAVNINRLGTTAAALGQEMRQRAAAYAEATNALRAIGTAEATALANAAEADQTTHYAMSDMLRENGNDGLADKINAAFGETETFSLADLGDE